jgi:hypothetical protein
MISEGRWCHIVRFLTAPPVRICYVLEISKLRDGNIVNCLFLTCFNCFCSGRQSVSDINVDITSKKLRVHNIIKCLEVLGSTGVDLTAIDGEGKSYHSDLLVQF